MAKSKYTSKKADLTYIDKKIGQANSRNTVVRYENLGDTRTHKLNKQGNK